MGTGAHLYVEIAEGECVYLGLQLCGAMYDFLRDRYGLSAYEIWLRACEGDLAAMDLQQLRRKLFYSLVFFFPFSFVNKIFFTELFVQITAAFPTV